VLGQIDPGPKEARLVQELYAAAGQKAAHEPIPDEYWRLWRDETALADVIIVNSAWSRDALIEEDVPADKIRIVPLAYEGERRAPSSQPPHPVRFDRERPLRALFLGQVSLRKGVGPLLDAMRLLGDAPITLDIVGPVQVALPEWVRDDRRVRVHGPVARGKVRDYFERADLFLFPTLSDGFGLTQLEALAFGVPVIASRYCGDVVRHDEHGLVLDIVDAAAVAAALREIVADPPRLARWRKAARLTPSFSLDALGDLLIEIEREHSA
jgi:glycosyltransferase involved in cell wall biosynthesis